MLKLNFAVLAMLVLAIGCGQPGGPPAGAPESANSPKVEQGDKAAPAEAAPADAATSEPVSETKTALADGEWGTLKGRIVFDGKAPTPKDVDQSKDAACKVPQKDESLVVSDKGGLANAVIMLRTKDVQVNPAYDASAGDEITLDNKDCRFEPHVGVVRLSQTLLLKNSDPTGHNSHLYPLLNTEINPVLAAGGEPVKYKFAQEEAIPVKVGCNIHPWMGAWIVARKDPYAAVTDKDGNFEIKDLPAGKELEFGLWQENPGYLKNATFKGGKADTRGRFKIKIKPGDNDLGEIKVPGSIFKK